MRKLVCLMLLLFIWPLTSCNHQQLQQSEPEGLTIPEVQDYLGVEIQYSTTEQPVGTIEETVAAVYDSVVAIDSYLNGTLYGSGSGVLIGKNDTMSFLVTCHHVIEGCTSFQITLSDGTTLEASLVGGDAESDIAVLSVQATDLCYVSWYKDTDQLKLGSTVICIGNPLGTLPGSVSTGVISYINRTISVDNYHQMKLIQTDVAINSGNSGGALLNTAGALIGIVNAKYSSTGIEGLGFAIPAKEAMQIVDSILKTAYYNTETNNWLTGYVEGRWALEFSLGYGGYGFYRTSIRIASTATNSTASDYGKLQVNDVLKSITIHFQDADKMDKTLTNITASNSIESIYQFIYEEELSLGDMLVFEVQRNNQNITIEIPLQQYCYRIG